MSKTQFTGTATQPQYKRKFCQLKKDQYCKNQETKQHKMTQPFGYRIGGCRRRFSVHIRKPCTAYSVVKLWLHIDYQQLTVGFMR